MTHLLHHYIASLSNALEGVPPAQCDHLARDLDAARTDGRCVFLCGNGGSAANAIHWANDLLYGAGKTGRGGLRAHALPSNASICTCLANDVSFNEVFAEQLRVLASPGDMLIVFSGSGNSPNILRALEMAREMKMRSWAVLGFDGGKALTAADSSIHFRINDMQVAEDCQMALGHIVTRMLAEEV